MKHTTQRLVSIMAALALFGAGSLHAQTAVTGALIGYVSDASAAAVPGATVEATNTSTGVQQTSGHQ